MKKRVKIIVGAAVIGLVGAGGAFAFWSASGAGTGTVTTDTAQALVINQTADLTKLSPGSTPIVLLGTITNLNASQIRIPGIGVTLGTLPTGCTAADFAITGASGPLTIPANSTTTPWTGISVQLKETGLNQDACKGLAVPLVFAGTPTVVAAAPFTIAGGVVTVNYPGTATYFEFRDMTVTQSINTQQLTMVGAVANYSHTAPLPGGYPIITAGHVYQVTVHFRDASFVDSVVATYTATA